MHKCMFKSAHRRQLAREMPLITKKKPRQLSREDWTEAARKQLVAAGIEEVKVDRLARKMKVTRGSFYWHFKNRKDLLDSVLRVW